MCDGCGQHSGVQRSQLERLFAHQKLPALLTGSWGVDEERLADERLALRLLRQHAVERLLGHLLALLGVRDLLAQPDLLGRLALHLLLQPTLSAEWRVVTVKK